VLQPRVPARTLRHRVVVDFFKIHTPSTGKADEYTPLSDISTILLVAKSTGRRDNVEINIRQIRHEIANAFSPITELREENPPLWMSNSSGPDLIGCCRIFNSENETRAGFHDKKTCSEYVSPLNFILSLTRRANGPHSALKTTPANVDIIERYRRLRVLP